MQLTHNFTVPVSIDEVWAAFNDLESVAPCFPGASLSSYDGEGFAGAVKVKLGPISLQYAGTGRFVERDESAHRAVVEAKGKDKRGNGTAGAGITAQLTAKGDDSTEVEVTTDLNITGRPAQFGRGVMQDVSDKLLGQFVACLEKQLGTSPAGPEASQPASAPSASSRPASAASPETAAAGDGGGSAGAASAATGSVGLAGAAGAASGAGMATAADPEIADQAGNESSVAAGKHRASDGSMSTGQSTPPAELDLGMTVLPVLAKRYAPYLAGAVGAVMALAALKKLLFGSRRTRRSGR